MHRARHRPHQRRLRVTPDRERHGEQMGESAIPENHALIRLALRVHQRPKTLHQIHQVRVDVASLLASLARRVRAVQTLAARQVHDAAGRDDLSHELLVRADEVERAHCVRTRGVQIHFGLRYVLFFGAHRDDLHPFAERRDLLFLRVNKDSALPLG